MSGCQKPLPETPTPKAPNLGARGWKRMMASPGTNGRWPKVISYACYCSARRPARHGARGSWIISRRGSGGGEARCPARGAWVDGRRENPPGFRRDREKGRFPGPFGNSTETGQCQCARSRCRNRGCVRLTDHGPQKRVGNPFATRGHFRGICRVAKTGCGNGGTVVFPGWRAEKRCTRMHEE